MVGTITTSKYQVSSMSRQDSVLVALRRIIRATDQNSKRLSRNAGLTVPQTVLMRAIEAHPDATLGFLTGQISLSQATVTTIVDRLEERGLLARQRNSRDKRVVNVTLTEAGRQLLARSPQPLQEQFRQRFQQLPMPQQDLIVNALDSVAAMMGASAIDAAPILTLGQIPEQFPGHDATTLRPVATRTPDIVFRTPTAADGGAVHALIRICPPLDQNSLYANLLQCTHFQDTCVLAEQQGQVVGFVSGYQIPARPDTLFVWQIAVHPDRRGQRLAQRMLDELLGSARCRQVRFLETTVTTGNAASAALFAACARARNTTLTREPLFDRRNHFDGNHDTEWLLQIGPFTSGAIAADPAGNNPDREACTGA